MAQRSLLWMPSVAWAALFLQLACGGTGATDSGSGGQVGSGGATGGQVGTGGAGTGGGTGSGGAASGGAGTGGASASGGTQGSGGWPDDACPETPPSDGTVTCSGSRPANCHYEDCDGVGEVSAICDGSVYQVATGPCVDFNCGSETCTPGQICTISAGGAFIGTCVDDPCGDGPVTCECGYPSCSQACFTSGDPGYGIDLTCVTCPNGQACP